MNEKYNSGIKYILGMCSYVAALVSPIVSHSMNCVSKISRKESKSKVGQNRFLAEKLSVDEQRSTRRYSLGIGSKMAPIILF